MRSKQKNLQIKDSESQEGIPGVTYRYGFQKGVSDENGQISLLIDGETWLYLSHLSYSSWTLDPNELAEAANTSVIFRREQLHGLQPVSVISLKMSEEKDKKNTHL
ncbi:hypothetical protein [Algoriphagus boritolerans]|uniref:hypothetical protein n=1 Tax=Algoriphagus boritolerans TaxID=308111 RepID=UPI000AEA7825